MRTGLTPSRREATSNIVDSAYHEAAIWTPIGSPSRLVPNRRVIAGMPVNPKLIESVVREALQQVEDTAEVVIQLHPDDLALLQKHKSDVLKPPPNSSGTLKRTFDKSATTVGGSVAMTVLDAL